MTDLITSLEGSISQSGREADAERDEDEMGNTAAVGVVMLSSNEEVDLGDLLSKERTLLR